MKSEDTLMQFAKFRTYEGEFLTGNMSWSFQNEAKEVPKT